MPHIFDQGSFIISDFAASDYANYLRHDDTAPSSSEQLCWSPQASMCEDDCDSNPDCGGNSGHLFQNEMQNTPQTLGLSYNVQMASLTKRIIFLVWKQNF